MKIEEFIEKSPSLEPIERLIQKIWQKLQKDNRWPQRPIRLTKATLHKVIRLQSIVDQETGGDLPQYSLEANVETIASNWDWKRNPAPIQLLEGEKVWKALANKAAVDIQEKEASHEETLQGALRWTKLQVQARPKPTTATEIQKTIREIEDAARALGKLEDLSPRQKQQWKQALEGMFL